MTKPTSAITFLGTGDAATLHSFCTSFVLSGPNHTILFDVGQGVMTLLRINGFDVHDIDTIVISHFHPDHIADIIYFLSRHQEHCYINQIMVPLTIIGPKGTRDVITRYTDCQVSNDDDPKDGSQPSEIVVRLKKYFKAVPVIELDDNGEEHTWNSNKIKTFAIEHGQSKGNGYLITMGSNVIGCSGDSNLCPALRDNIKNAGTWILDCAGIGPKGSDRHATLTQIIELGNKYPDKTFYCVHRRDWTPPELPKNVICPTHGDVFPLF